MSYCDVLTLAALTAVNSASNGGTFDFRGYVAGTIVANFSAVGTTLTPFLEISPDNGTTWTSAAAAIPASVMAAPAAITATGVYLYPFLIPISLPWVRMAWGSVTGSFTGTFKAFMRN